VRWYQDQDQVQNPRDPGNLKTHMQPVLIPFELLQNEVMHQKRLCLSHQGVAVGTSEMFQGRWMTAFGGAKSVILPNGLRLIQNQDTPTPHNFIICKEPTMKSMDV
jgi:hypothetical protein